MQIHDDEKDVFNTGVHYYVGGRNVNRILQHGDWRWIKHGRATKMMYNTFAFNQGPGGKPDSEKDCIFFYASDRYKFHDQGCDNGRYLGGYIFTEICFSFSFFQKWEDAGRT